MLVKWQWGWFFVDRNFGVRSDIWTQPQHNLVKTLRLHSTAQALARDLKSETNPTASSLKFGVVVPWPLPQPISSMHAAQTALAYDGAFSTVFIACSPGDHTLQHEHSFDHSGCHGHRPAISPPVGCPHDGLDRINCVFSLES